MTFLTRTAASQPEILRAAQKDEQVTDKLSDLIADVTYNLGGNRRRLRARKWREVIGNALYYGMTTIAGFQTLGEEYTGIVQIDHARANVPSKFLRLSLVLFSCGGELLLLDLLRRLEDYLKLGRDVHHLTPEAQALLLSYISAIRALIPYIHKLHKGLFYLEGNYYHIAKRLTGINYLMVRPWLKAGVSRYSFRVLGAISLLYLLLISFHRSSIWWKQKTPTQKLSTQVSERGSSDSSTKLRCVLCLEDAKSKSVTPCGHFFCWNCIFEWVQTQQICPVCREKVLPSRIVLLHNYDAQL
ncbi:Peroxisome biogenesis factor 10 [Blattella germanica]|nr:Peroxisome biogenesis factor 10 [Blattella germanica]